MEGDAIRFLVVLFLILMTLVGCKKNGDCVINYFISGTVTDSNGVPIDRAEVHLIDTYNFDVSRANTDTSGKYSFFLGSYSDVGNSYIVIKKTGYKNFSTSAIGKGNGTCGDQQLIYDAILEN